MSKMKDVVLTIFLVLLGTAVFSQTGQTGSIKGKIIDAKTKEALEFVNVSIRTKDSGKTLVTGTVTDSTGVFHLSRIKNGTYILSASYIGYRTLEKEFTISSKERNINLRNLLLEEDAQAISEVQVVAQRAQMRFEIDKKVFDVASNISQAGGSASDILGNIPSVEVDNEGEISLRGNSSVTIWINGKASGLTADNQAQILEQIPAESIERIELITNPSAKFSPEGTSGIINIILKKDRKAGYYGSIQTGADTQGGYNASANINYNSGKVETYLNAGYRQRKSEGEDNTNRTNTDEAGNPVSYLNQKGKSDRNGSSVFVRAGITYNFTPKDHLSLEAFAHFGDRKSDNMIRYESNVPGSFTTSERLTHSKNSSNGNNINLDYKHEFNKNSNITARASWDLWKSDGTDTYKQHSFYPEGKETASWQQQESDNRSQSWEFQVDYVNKFSEDSKVEAGYKGSLSNRKSPVETYSGATEASAVLDELLFNKYIYDQNIQALYATYSTKLNQFGVQVGLRGEYTDTETKSLGYGEHRSEVKPYKNDYFSLFPNANVSYALAKDGSYSLIAQYARTIERPRFWTLNPQRYQISDYTYQTGNPKLDPAYKHDASLTLVLKHKYTLTGGIVVQTGEIQQTMRPDADDPKRLCIAWVNYDTTKSYYVSANAPCQFAKWWTMNLNATYIRQGQRVDQHTPEAHYNFYFANASTTFTLPAKFYIDLSYRLQGRMDFGNCWVEPMHFLNAGIKKRFGDKFTAACSVRNLIDRPQHVGARGEGFVRRVDMSQQWNCREFRISLSYNFKSGKAFKRRAVEAGSADEKSRL